MTVKIRDDWTNHEFEGVELSRHRMRKAPHGIEFTIYGIPKYVTFAATVRMIHDESAPTHDSEGRELVTVIVAGHSLEALREELEIWLRHHYRTRDAEIGREAIRRAVRAVRDDPSGDLLAGLLDGAARKRFEQLSRDQQRRAMDLNAPEF